MELCVFVRALYAGVWCSLPLWCQAEVSYTPLKRLEKMVNQVFALVRDPTCDGYFILFPVSGLWAAPF